MSLIRRKNKYQLYDKKYKIPYTYHLEEVVSIVESYGKEAMIIAYLHDVVEDTDVTIEDIKNIFGNFISECVYFLTDEDGNTRAERKKLTNIKLKKVPYSHNIALVVKAADRLANINESYIKGNSKYFNRYIQEYNDFKISVHRQYNCDNIWLHLDFFHTLKI